MPRLNRRSLLGSALATLAAGPAAAQTSWVERLSALTAQANQGTVGIMAGGVDGTYIRIAADLMNVLDEGDRMRVIAMLGRGSVQNLRDIVLLRGIDIGIVQSDVLAFARREQLLPGIDRLVQYITKLYDEEIHLLAREDVRSVRDLAGRIVNVDVRGSGTAMTSSLVLEALGVNAQIAHDPQDVALTRLRNGEIGAAVYVAGKPARLYAGIAPGSGLHFIPIPATPGLLETYLPSTLSSADYPNLIPAGTEVETIAVGAVMAVYAWQPGTERYRKVARFVHAFTRRFDEFLRPPRHPKWREVNLAAQVPGWIRFDPGPPS
jgi:TRAP transporter TAXI family solute receptor